MEKIEIKEDKSENWLGMKIECNRMEWDEYYMANAFLAALRSKDPVTKVGACIVNDEKKIVGIGYNGFPIGCKDDEFPWTKNTVDPLDSKYLYVCHAEVNAILNKNSANVKGCDIYVALFPCNGCAKMIIQCRIKKVIYFSDKYATATIASKKMFDAAGVQYVQLIPSTVKRPIELDFFDVSQVDKLELNRRNDFAAHQYLSWKDYFMSTAILASHRSGIANKRTGACIINAENRIVGIGYYGLPINCNYADFPCTTAADEDLYFCHAEMNAYANKNCESVKHCTIYVTKFPCSDCAKILIQSGIKKIWYLNHEDFDSVTVKAACRMFDAVGIEYSQHKMIASRIVIDFTIIDKNVKK